MHPHRFTHTYIRAHMQHRHTCMHTHTQYTHKHAYTLIHDNTHTWQHVTVSKLAVNKVALLINWQLANWHVPCPFMKNNLCCTNPCYILLVCVTEQIGAFHAWWKQTRRRTSQWQGRLQKHRQASSSPGPQDFIQLICSWSSGYALDPRSFKDVMMG